MVRGCVGTGLWDGGEGGEMRDGNADGMERGSTGRWGSEGKSWWR